MTTADNARQLWDFLLENPKEPITREELKAALGCTDEQLAEARDILIKVLDQRIAEAIETSRKLSIPIAQRRASKEIRRMIAYG